MCYEISLPGINFILIPCRTLSTLAQHLGYWGKFQKNWWKYFFTTTSILKPDVLDCLKLLMLLFIVLRLKLTSPDAETSNAPPPAFKEPPIEFFKTNDKN